MASPPGADYVRGLSPREREIYRFMVERFGQWVTGDQIATYVYQLDPDGGPEAARRTIDVHVFRLRRKLIAVGLMIDGGHQGRRLTWAASPAELHGCRGAA